MTTTTRHLLRRDLVDLISATLPEVDVHPVPPGQQTKDEMIVVGLLAGDVTYPAFAAASTLLRNDLYTLELHVITHVPGRGLEPTIDRTAELVAAIEQVCIDTKVTPSLMTADVELLSMLVTSYTGPHAEPAGSGEGWVGWADVTITADVRQM